MIHCMDGTQMEVHQAYQFIDTEYNNSMYSKITRILEECAQYTRGRQGRITSRGSVVREITTETNNDMCSLNEQVSRL